MSKTAHIIKISTLIALTPLFITSCGGGGDSDQDPLVVNEPVAYVERPLPLDANDMIESEDILEPDAYQAGAALYVKERGSASAPATNITDRAFSPGELYDVKDLNVSYDGRRLVFAMRGPLDPNENNDDNQPRWRLWEYDVDSDSLTRVFPLIDDLTDFHDISPAYLPNGRIVFSSTRQTRSRNIIANQGGSPYAATVNGDDVFNLHTHNPAIDPNGNFVDQITFNQGHDLQPSVLSDGRIVFLRHESLERGGDDRLSLYTINPDGSNLRPLYGFNSQNTGNVGNNVETTFVDVREVADGSLVAVLKTRESTLLGGDVVRINSQGFIDINQPTYDNRGDTGQGQASIAPETIDLAASEPSRGYFNSVYPIGGGSSNFLVSWWGLCQLLDPTTGDTFVCNSDNLDNPALEIVPAAYWLWNYNFSDNTQSLVARPDSGFIFTDAVWMEDRQRPEFPTATIDVDLQGRGFAALHIHSVYDTDGNDTSTAGINVLADPLLTAADERPARFIRFIQAVSIPDDDEIDFNEDAFALNNRQRGMRSILGYSPIEPDGSVKAEVPADIAFYFDVVDADGERISPVHRNLMHVSAGETYECTGCHTRDSDLPHGRLDAEAPSSNPGALIGGAHFANTVFSNIEDVEAGDTMAEVYAKAPDAANANGARPLSNGPTYSDDWTDPAVRTPDSAYQLSYAALTPDAPVISACLSNWRSTCSSIINYPDHIQALWNDTTRPTGSCISCHSASDSGGNPQVPAGQLQLTESSYDPLDPSNGSIRNKSYFELLQQDAPKILNPAGDAFLPLFVPNTVTPFYLDIDGNQILDINGNPIPEVRTFIAGTDNPANILLQSFTGNVVDVYLDAGAQQIRDANGNPIEIVNVPINPNDIPPDPVMVLRRNGVDVGAAGSRFFDKMEGNAGTVDHSSFMTPNELRLLREWLDIGGQYYNSPLDAPLN